MNKSTIKTLTNGKRVPTMYDLRYSQVVELIDMANAGGIDGQLDAITAAYNAGFQRGRNYERNKAKAQEKSKNGKPVI